MKTKLGLIIILLAFIVVACKKDVPPTLIVKVVEEDGTAAGGADVHVYPKDAQLGVVNEKDFDKKGTTASDGTVTFEFPYSAVLDIDVTYIKETWIDTALAYTYDTLYGHRVTKIETKRQRGDNEFNETVEVK